MIGISSRFVEDCRKGWDRHGGTSSLTNCHPLRVGARATAFDDARVKTTVDVVAVEISDGDFTRPRRRRATPARRSETQGRTQLIFDHELIMI